ncbi:MAG: hypothetical protein WCB18_06710 [Thermoplasmata archaeon]
MPPDRDPPSVPPAPSSSRGGTRDLVLAAVFVALVVLLAPVAFPELGYGVGFHTECRAGALLATESLWTPRLWLNAPDPGMAWANASSGVGTGASNGSSSGLFALDQWNLTARVNSSVPGPGLSTPCRYGMTITHSSGNILDNVALTHPSNESDAEEVDNFRAVVLDMMSPQYGMRVSSVTFENGLVGGGDSQVESCFSETPEFYHTQSSFYTVTVTFFFDGRNVPLATSVTGPVAHSYELGPGHVWAVYDPESARPPSGGGMAFGPNADCTA